MRQSLFDPHTTKYRHQNAHLLAKASSLAYQSPDVIQPEVVKWGFPQFTFIDRKDSQAFLAGNAEMIIIAFRGTEPTTLQDWMTDVRSGPRFLDSSISEISVCHYAAFSPSGAPP